jgi:LacI family transcriptional regulator
MPQTIAIAHAADYGYTRGVTLGVGRALATSPFVANAFSVYQLPPASVAGTYAGAVVFIASQETYDAVRRWNIPVVNVSRSFATPDVPTVTIDSVACGRLAADHLISRGHRHFAFVEQPERLFSDERRDGFSDRLAAAGHALLRMPGPAHVAPHERLQALPRPLGLMCASDHSARPVIHGLNAAGVRVPEDVAVVGVDNDEMVCLLTTTTISSVDVRAELIGETAAKLLTRHLSTGAPMPPLTLIPPGRVIVRESSDVSATDDPLVLRAVAVIKERALAGLNVDQLVDALDSSRRTLERRFREQLGHSPAQEIERVRLERAASLLLDTRLPVDEVAERVGFGNDRRMRRLFARRFGQSPAAFREEHRG